MPRSITTQFQGTALAFQKALASQLLLILAAIVTVYICLLYTSRPPLWADATETERDEIIEALLAAGDLTTWETDFVKSIADQYGDRELSEKQAAIVDRIAKRVLGTWENRA